MQRRKAVACLFIVLIIWMGVPTGPATFSAQASTRAAGAVDPNGIIKVPFDFTQPIPLYFDPKTSGTNTVTVLLATVYGGLMNRVSPTKVEPGLAKSIDIVNPTTVKITLRPNLKFTDGTPLDAAAVKYSLERIASSNNTAGLRMEVLGTLDNVEVVDPLTAIVHSKTANAALWADLLPDPDAAIVSPTAARAADAANPKIGLGKAPVGAGPFMIKSWSTQGVELVKNPNYYDAANVHLGGIQFVNVTAASCVTALQTGAVDWVSVPLGTGAACLDTPSAELFAKTPGFKVDRRTEDGPYMIQVNKSKPPLNSLEFRQALNYAIDRKALMKTIFGGNGQPVATLFPKGFPLYDGNAKDTISYNPKKAKELLAKSGVGPNPSFTVTGGPSGNAVTDRTLEVVQAQLQKVGIDMKIIPTASLSSAYFVQKSVQGAILKINRPGIYKITSCCLQSSFSNVDSYPLPTIASDFTKLAALVKPTDAATKPLWNDMQHSLIVDNAWAIFLGMKPIYNVWNTGRIKAFPLTSSTTTGPFPYFAGVTIKR